MADYGVTAVPSKNKKPPNTATICDYNQNLLGDVVKSVKVGSPVSLSLRGKVTRIEEQYGSGMDRCEIGLEPSAVSLGGGRAEREESMVDQMNREQRSKAGQDDYEEPEADEEEDY